MLSFLPGTVRGVLAAIFWVVNLLFWVIFLLPFAIIKLIVPIKAVRRPMDSVLNFICTRWASCNKMFLMFLNDIRWDVEGDEDLSMKDWYLVLSNHQSWADIMVLQFVFNNRIPYFRFFLKQQLAWFPIFNFVWYALDYPFMKRYSKEFLEKNPHLRGKDIESVRKSCEKYRDIPVAIMNFVEGTRFRPEKHRKQKSPFNNLLRPRAGGLALVFSVIGDQLQSLLNVTIVYPPGDNGLWSLLCGRIPEVVVRIDRLPIDKSLIGDYDGDPEFRERFQNWLNALWVEKDKRIEELTH